MKAIYNGKLYRVGVTESTVRLIDEETGEEVTASYGEPDLIIDPTDDEINNILPDYKPK
jgi:hypothetical protein